MRKFRGFVGADLEVRATAGWEAGATPVSNLACDRLLGSNALVNICPQLGRDNAPHSPLAGFD